MFAPTSTTVIPGRICSASQGTSPPIHRSAWSCTYSQRSKVGTVSFFPRAAVSRLQKGWRLNRWMIGMTNRQVLHYSRQGLHGRSKQLLPIGQECLLGKLARQLYALRRQLLVVCGGFRHLHGQLPDIPQRIEKLRSIGDQR